MRHVIAALLIVTASSAAVASERTLKGELVDVQCRRSDDANRGDAHVDCALSCAKRGAVLGILTDDGVYTVTGEFTFEQNRKLIPFVAKQVSATGDVTETDDLRTIRLTAIEEITSETGS